MIHRSRNASAPALLCLLLLSACGGEGDATSGDDRRDRDESRVQTSGDFDQVALAVSVVSAFPDPEVQEVPTPPSIRITGDGSFRAFDHVEGETRLLTGQLEQPELSDLLSEADALATSGYGDPGLDGSFTTVTLGSASGTTPRAIEVWVPEAQGYEGSAAERRGELVAFLDHAADAVREAGRTWEPDQWFLISSEQYAGPGGEPLPVWPLDDVDPLSGEALSHRLGCQVIDAATAKRVRDVLDTQSSPSAGPSGWTIDGVPYSLRIVPVLTNETCAELEPYRYPIE
ncbi:hypothetical protein [Nocardioides sp. GXZ039]|uniref:hypothetical protein n=1 Tax=Nocardioides sp. GXZ039 TaxID=3136018 RepID=UPI0030F485B9